MTDHVRAAEVDRKLHLIRTLSPGTAVRLRGVDWFAWATAGGSSAVLLTAETGVAEVVVTPSEAWVVTDTIEAERLRQEQLPHGLSLQAAPWAAPLEKEAFIRELAAGAPVVSDRPGPGEGPLPPSLVREKRLMSPAEIGRYRAVGTWAAEAMTEALEQAQPQWSELQLAAAGAAALLNRGLDPGLVMAAGERRLMAYRHPMPQHEPLGAMAMLVFCARGFGLYANLTRFVSFGRLPAELAERHRLVREVECLVLDNSRPPATLGHLYGLLAQGYADRGHPDAIRQHHQGGTTGYLSRETVALPDSAEYLETGSVVAWNPSLAGAKVEDTFLVTDEGLDILTLDRHWPTVTVGGRERALVLER